MNQFPQTMDPERFKDAVGGIVDPALVAYGEKIQGDGVRLHTVPEA